MARVCGRCENRSHDSEEKWAIRHGFAVRGCETHHFCAATEGGRRTEVSEDEGRNE